MSDAFDYVKTIVIDDTGRPEMDNLDANNDSVLRRRIKRSVIAMHRMDFWKKDFVEQKYVFQNSQAVQIIDLTKAFPRHRAIGYIRKWNSAAASLMDPAIFSGAAGEMFKEINPQQVFDGYGYDRRNSMYRSEDSIKLNSSEAIQEILVGWFQDPFFSYNADITISDSWILLEYPDLIAAHAKRRIFKDIGKDEEARSSKEEYEEELLRLQANNIKLGVLQQ